MSLWPRTVKILISNWPRTRKFSHFFKNKGGEDLFLPWSRVGHALRPIFVPWLVKIWQVSSCWKFMQHLESCLLWQLKLTEFFCQLVMFLTVFFHWMYKMKYSCYQESSVIHGWFVYEVFGWEMRRLSKLGNPLSDGIVFVFHLAQCVRGCLRLLNPLTHWPRWKTKTMPSESGLANFDKRRISQPKT